MLGISHENAGASSSSAGGSGDSKDPHAHKRGPKPRSLKDKGKSKEKEKAASEKKEANVKKEAKDKKPAFLQQTASGRTPKVASRYALLFSVLAHKRDVPTHNQLVLHFWCRLTSSPPGSRSNSNSDL